MPDWCLGSKKYSGIKGSKARLTYTFTINTNDSKKKRLFVIDKYAHLQVFSHQTEVQLGFYY